MPLIVPYGNDTLSPHTFCPWLKNWLNFGELNLRQPHQLLHQLDHRQQTNQAPWLRRKQQIQTESSYLFNHGQNVLEYGVDRAVRAKLRYISSFRGNFCDTNAECRECYSILQNTEPEPTHYPRIQRFPNCAMLHRKKRATCQSNTTYRYIWGLN